MAEYIEREALPQKKERGFFLDEDFNAGWNACLNNIESIHAADVAPVRHGKWVWDENGMDWGIGSWRCSECHTRPETWWQGERSSPLNKSGRYYCPNCGATMDGGGE